MNLKKEKNYAISTKKDVKIDNFKHIQTEDLKIHFSNDLYFTRIRQIGLT